MMDITILGCGDAFGSGGKLQTSFFIETEGQGLLLDCGATIVPALHQQDISSNRIDAVVITHFHGDHYGGLPYLLLEAAKRYKRQKPLTLLSPPGLQQKLESLLLLLYPGTEDVLESFPIHYKNFEPGGQELLPGVQVQAWEVIHAADSQPHGVRIIAGGKVLAFSGDTSWHENLIPLSKGADLFICECNFWEGENKAHLSWEILKQHLPQLAAKEIKLTHASSEVLKKQHELPFEILADGGKISL